MSTIGDIVSLLEKIPIWKRLKALPDEFDALKAKVAALESELKHLIVDVLSLKDVKPQEIDSGAPLLVEGLGLDSIDALELAMAIGKRYSIKFSSEESQNREAFASVRSLAQYVAKNRPAPAAS